MIIKVKVEDTIFEVEIEEVDTNPILARIGNEEFEVWAEKEKVKSGEQRSSQPLPISNGLQTKSSEKVVASPIPGVVSSLLVQPGQKINPGDPLLVIEAMKMNNTIRANRSGTIAAIKVETGAFVKHHQELIEYTD